MRMGVLLAPWLPLALALLVAGAAATGVTDDELAAKGALLTGVLGVAGCMAFGLLNYCTKLILISSSLEWFLLYIY